MDTDARESSLAVAPFTLQRVYMVVAADAAVELPGPRVPPPMNSSASHIGRRQGRAGYLGQRLL